MLFFGPPLGPNTPEWLLWVTGISLLITMFAVLVWVLVLERRYTGPYTLLTASSHQKWRWAITLMFWQTILIPMMGLIAPIISPHPDQWPYSALICGGIWIVVSPVSALYRRWSLERQLSRYRKMNEMIKRGMYKRLFSNPFLSWTKLLMSAELKRFLEEGYPENCVSVPE